MSNEIDWKARAEAAESKLREISEWMEHAPFLARPIRDSPLNILHSNLDANRMIGLLSAAIAAGHPITVRAWNDAVVAATR